MWIHGDVGFEEAKLPPAELNPIDANSLIGNIALNAIPGDTKMERLPDGFQVRLFESPEDE